MRHSCQEREYGQPVARSAIGILASCASSSAHADAIIPYMVVPWGEFFLLPIVVVVEAAILQGMLGGRFADTLGQSFVANIASTLLGAGLYAATMSWWGNPLFAWWFQGSFATATIRNACIALGFAVILWFLSWLVETFVVARMRKAISWKQVGRACAFANFATYAGLFVIALWFQQ
jgi:hypothetical protein